MAGCGAPDPADAAVAMAGVNMSVPNIKTITPGLEPIALICGAGGAITAPLLVNSEITAPLLFFSALKYGLDYISVV
jgi:hypothetical protein